MSGPECCVLGQFADNAQDPWSAQHRDWMEDEALFCLLFFPCLLADSSSETWPLKVEHGGRIFRESSMPCPTHSGPERGCDLAVWQGDAADVVSLPNAGHSVYSRVVTISWLGEAHGF